MIYTIGDTQTYDPLISNGGGVKSGRGSRPGYPGGSVWLTAEEAERWCDPAKRQVVYGVLADWERDTEPSASGMPWRDLLFDRPLVRLAREEAA